MKIALINKPSIVKVSSFLIALSLIASIPSQANAGFFSDIGSMILGVQVSAKEAPIIKNDGVILNSQVIPLLESSINPDLNNMNDQDDTVIVQSDSFISSDGLFVFPDIKFEKSLVSDQIRVYTVATGDTLSEIADSFNVSTNTIRWENNISGEKISIGQKLNILPVTGVKHVIKSGDTIGGIANKYEADSQDISVFNGILDSDVLKAGDVLFVPNGIIKPVVLKTTSSSSKTPSKTNVVSNTKADSGYYIRPVPGIVTSPYGPRKRDFHTGVDLAGVKGVTPVSAAASGIVTKVINGCKEGYKSCGGGYGNYLDIVHSNGTTTRYAHLSKTSVSVGQTVSQGQTIGILGNTGISTGPHLHFEVINANGSKMKPPVY